MANQYVNNDDLRLALTEFRKYDVPLKQFDFWVTEEIEGRTGTRKVDRGGNFIGECIVKICNGLGMSRNFIAYTYREEMVEDAIENCIRYIRNYDPAISKYAFTYFSRIAFFAFIRRIKKEQAQQRIRYRLLSDSVELNNLMEKHNNSPNSDVDLQGFVNSIHQMMAENEIMIEVKEKPKPKKKTPKDSITKFIKPEPK